MVPERIPEFTDRTDGWEWKQKRKAESGKRKRRPWVSARMSSGGTRAVLVVRSAKGRILPDRSSPIWPPRDANCPLDHQNYPAGGRIHERTFRVGDSDGVDGTSTKRCTLSEMLSIPLSPKAPAGGDREFPLSAFRSPLSDLAPSEMYPRDSSFRFPLFCASSLWATKYRFLWNQVLGRKICRRFRFPLSAFRFSSPPTADTKSATTTPDPGWSREYPVVARRRIGSRPRSTSGTSDSRAPARSRRHVHRPRSRYRSTGS
jgi:hypothetical protein